MGKESATPSKVSSSSSTSTKEEDATFHDIFEYIQALPRPTLLRLYGDETRGRFACKAILQRLPELARQYILRLAVCGSEFPMLEVDKWNSMYGSRDSAESIRKMEAFHVIEPTRLKKEDEEDDDLSKSNASASSSAAEDKKSTKKSTVLRLTPEFYNGIQQCLTSVHKSSQPWNEIAPSDQAAWIAQANSNTKTKQRYYPPPPTPEELEIYTQKRWDSILHFLVGSEGEEEPPDAIEHFLKMTGLMQDDPDFKPGGGATPSAVITSKGYEFMLQDCSVQVWQFIHQYLNSVGSHPERETIRCEALLFLICLSYCRVGSAYPASSLTPYSKTLMKDFSQFGLLDVRKLDSSSRNMFYPTRVAVDLVAAATYEVNDRISSGPSASATRALEMALNSPIPPKSHIAIIVQTNFQLCAYTTSELHVAMLALFCELSNYRRLPNIVFFQITRDSVKSAFRLGINAKQIIQFLTMHSHPKLRTGDQPLLPPNVRDQIRLWDKERSRVVLTEVYCHQCHSKEEFVAVHRYSQDIGAHGWSSELKNKIFVRYDMAERVMGFVRRWRTRHVQRASRQTSYS